MPELISLFDKYVEKVAGQKIEMSLGEFEIKKMELILE